MEEFIISYTVITFDDIYVIGTLSVNADSLEEVEQCAYITVINKLKSDAEHEEMTWHNNIKSLQIQIG